METAKGEQNAGRSAASLLLVEDDPEARSLVDRALSLKFRDLRLLTAENGAAGLELYREHRPDIVLTDVKMPVMDGLAMATRIRELHPGAVIVVLSAFCDAEQFRASADRIGIAHWLLKPIDYRMLFATIDRCLHDLDAAGAPAGGVGT